MAPREVKGVGRGCPLLTGKETGDAAVLLLRKLLIF